MNRPNPLPPSPQAVLADINRLTGEGFYSYALGFGSRIYNFLFPNPDDWVLFAAKVDLLIKSSTNPSTSSSSLPESVFAVLSTYHQNTIYTLKDQQAVNEFFRLQRTQNGGSVNPPPLSITGSPASPPDSPPDAD